MRFLPLYFLAALMLVLGELAPPPHGVPYYALTILFGASALWRQYR